MTWDESEVVAAQRAEEALRPGRRTTLAIAAEASYDPEGSHYPDCRYSACSHSRAGRDCPTDPWAEVPS